MVTLNPSVSKVHVVAFPVALAAASLLAAGTARAGIIVNAVGIGQATGDVWGHLAMPPGMPPNPPTHTLTVAGFLPNVTLGPSLSLCDPQTFVAVTAIDPTPFTYRYGQDGRAFNGDAIGADGSDLAALVRPVSGACQSSIDITETLTPTSVHFIGEMIASDSGAASRLRLIDGSDPVQPIIIYEDLFLNPGSTPLTRPIDLDFPLPSGGPGALFIQLDIYGASLPSPSAVPLLGLAGLLAARRRR